MEEKRVTLEKMETVGRFEGCYFMEGEEKLPFQIGIYFESVADEKLTKQIEEETEKVIRESQTDDAYLEQKLLLIDRNGAKMVLFFKIDGTDIYDDMTEVDVKLTKSELRKAVRWITAAYKYEVTKNLGIKM